MQGVENVLPTAGVRSSVSLGQVCGLLTFCKRDTYNTSRYGNGIYTCLNPALADKYATSSSTSPYRAMIACDVSIAAESNSDQINDGVKVFVSKVEAIRPRYVILYK